MRCACEILWGLSVPTIFFHIKTHDFRKKSYWTQNVFWFSLQLLSETFLIVRRTERNMTNNVRILVFISNARFSRQSLMNIEIYQLIFRKIFKYKNSGKSLQWKSSCFMRKDRQTDGQHMTKLIIIIIIIIIFINCNWVVTRWQWLFYMYTNMKKSK